MSLSMFNGFIRRASIEQSPGHTCHAIHTNEGAQALPHATWQRSRVAPDGKTRPKGKASNAPRQRSQRAAREAKHVFTSESGQRRHRSGMGGQEISARQINHARSKGIENDETRGDG